MTQYLYIVSMDIPENLESEFNRIYDTQHIPNILNVSGVESCTRYRRHPLTLMALRNTQPFTR